MMNKMRVIDADWSPKGNILVMDCNCGKRFRHPSWRKWATCPDCGEKGDLIYLKSKDAEDAIDLRKAAQ